AGTVAGLAALLQDRQHVVVVGDAGGDVLAVAVAEDAAADGGGGRLADGFAGEHLVEGGLEVVPGHLLVLAAAADVAVVDAAAVAEHAAGIHDEDFRRHLGPEGLGDAELLVAADGEADLEVADGGGEGGRLVGGGADTDEADAAFLVRRGQFGERGEVVAAD